MRRCSGESRRSRRPARRGQVGRWGDSPGLPPRPALRGRQAGAAVVDRLAIEVLGEALEGSDRPLVIASGVFGIAPGRKVTEQDGIDAAEGTDGPILGASDRMANAHYTAALAARGVRSCVLRLPPTCHGDGDNGFMSILVGVARDKGVSGYVGDGSSAGPRPTGSTSHERAGWRSRQRPPAQRFTR